MSILNRSHAHLPVADRVLALGRAAENFAEEAEEEISEGRFQRSMAIVAALSAVVSGYEAYSQHLRGAFSDRLMWTPVWLTVPVALSAFASLYSRVAARVLLPLASLVSVVDGVLGFALHLRGIGRMPGGFKVGQYNIVMGPPVFAPMLVTIVGVLGLLASVLRPEVLPLDRVAEEDSIASRILSATRRDDDALFGGRVARAISRGRFQKGMAITSAFFAILAGGEAYFGHMRGSFNQRLMWLPVWATPPMVAAGIGAVWSRSVAKTLLPAASLVNFFVGLIGFFLHLRGIKRMPGGFSNFEFNATMGPPLFVPLLFTSVGLMGLIASLFHRGDD